MQKHMEAETGGGKPMTVGQWVARFPQAARIFEARGVDYCCGGKLRLEDACAQAGFDPAVLEADLDDVLKNPGAARTDWFGASLKDLADHIESTHHAFIRSEGPRLSALARKVAEVHGSRHPELVELSITVDRVFRELEPHLEKEEREVFPICRKVSDRGQRHGPDYVLPSAVNDLGAEHIEVGRLLAGMRRSAKGYQAPPDACDSYRALYHGLERFEADLHEHIHLENNILLPRMVMAAGKTDAKEGSPDSCCGLEPVS